MKAFQSSLAGIAAGRGQNDRLSCVTVCLFGFRHQNGKDRERNILKCAGRTVEKLQDPVIARADQRSQGRGIEFSGIGTLHDLIHVFKVRQKMRKDTGSRF